MNEIDIEVRQDEQLANAFMGEVMEEINEEQAIEQQIDMALDEMKELGFSKMVLMDMISPISKPLEQLKVLRIIRYGKQNLTDDLFLKPSMLKKA